MVRRDARKQRRLQPRPHRLRLLGPQRFQLCRDGIPFGLRPAPTLSMKMITKQPLAADRLSVRTREGPPQRHRSSTC